MQSVTQGFDDWSFVTTVVTCDKLIMISDRWFKLYNKYMQQKARLQQQPDQGGQLTTEQQTINRILTEVCKNLLEANGTIRGTIKNCETYFQSLHLVNHQDRNRIYSNFMSFNTSLNNCLDCLENDVHTLELISLKSFRHSS